MSASILNWNSKFLFRTIATRKLNLRPLVSSFSSSASMNSINSQSLEDWASKAKTNKTVFREVIDGVRLAHLRNTLFPYLPNNYPQISLDNSTQEAALGQSLFPNSHLVYFWLHNPETELSKDGYFSGEAPPPPYVQRVWAGGELQFDTSNPLKVGQNAQLTMKIDSVVEKDRPVDSGGPIVLVSMSRTVENDRGFSLKEIRNLAYMEKTNPTRKIIISTRLNAKNSDFSHSLTPTEILLFRYSALTWNSHRIHYDFNYSTKIEKHPHNLVHGPLTCTLLLELLRSNSPEGHTLANFNYRAISPLYSNQPLSIHGKWLDESKLSCELFALNNEGGVAMSGKATLNKTVS
ncbi:Mesaconyl-C(4)-CoA hydratase [Smittium mucronatum]|uniref:Mesaconyl-C(4)-CoA hydratase n=1 Tax=Smittium mucronatum TaxID=133383 RepID=A0A1R0GY24_9FUNG|nr:Mesaconyl-C(4)-CoA hydratase [Smittium mucronatum]